MKLIIGNKNYSSWSLRAWLALKQSGLAFQEVTLPLYGDAFTGARLEGGETQPSAGKVPVLWDGDVVVWDSLAILEFVADKVGRERFWPRQDEPRALARSIVAEMHSSFVGLRSECPMNVRRRIAGHVLGPAARADVIRVLQLWAEARARFGQGGPFLFGSFGAADIAYAPVVSRFLTYDIAVPGFAQTYIQALWQHDWLRQWAAAAEAEEWSIARFELGSGQ